MNIAIRQSLWLILCAFLASCGGGGSGSSDSINAVQSVSISPTGQTFAPGDEQQLTATATRDDGSEQNVTQRAAWSSSNTSVATVTGGLVRALAPGQFNAIVTVDGVSATARYTVGDQIERLELRRDGQAVSGSAVALESGEEDQLSAFTVSSAGEEQDVTDQATWVSSDADRVTVDQTGLVTAALRSTSPVSITASFTDPDSNQSFTSNAANYVVTAALTSIRVEPETATVAAGLTQQFTAVGTFADGAEETLANAMWSVADVAPSGSVTIDSASGLATAITEGGTATIVATNNDISSDTSDENGQLTVAEPIVESIAVEAPASIPRNASTNNPRLAANSDAKFTATASLSDGNTENYDDRVNWASSDTSIAIVDSTGLVSGIGAGSATITATFNNPQATDQQTVVGSIDIDVVQGNPTSISIGVKQPATLTEVAVGFDLQFFAEGSFADGSKAIVTDDVNWSVSSNASISTINNTDRKGRFTANGTGSNAISQNDEAEVTVFATVPGNSVASSVSVVIANATLDSIDVTPADSELPIQQTRQFTATGNFTAATGNSTTTPFTANLNDQVTWSVSVPDSATISETGFVSAIAEGEVTVTADCGANTPAIPQCSDALGNRTSGTATLTITDVIVESLVISATDNEVYCDGATNEDTTQAEEPECVADVPDGLTTQLFALATFTDGTTDTSFERSSNITFTAEDCDDNNVTAAGQVCANFSVSNNGGDDSDPSSNTRGLVTGLEPGTGFIRASVDNPGGDNDNDAARRIKIIVGDGVLNFICVEPIRPDNTDDIEGCIEDPSESAFSGAAGVTAEYRARGGFSDGTTSVLSASTVTLTADPADGVVNIEPGLTVRGVTAGIGQTANIIGSANSANGETITSAGNAVGAPYSVTAATLQSVAVMPATVDVPRSSVRQLSAIATFSDNTTRDVTTADTTSWSSSNSNIADVSNSGDAKGQVQASGDEGQSAVITAMYSLGNNDQSGSSTVTVTQAIVTGINITPANSSVTNGSTQQFTATALRGDGSGGDDITDTVTWSITNTDDGGRATISNDAADKGLATTTAPGTVRVFARFNNGDTNGDGNDNTATGSTLLTITE